MAETGLPKFKSRLVGKGVHLKSGFAAGAGANTNITVTGIRPGDQLVAVYELQPPTAGSGGAIVAERSTQTTITANDTIQISQSTTGNQVQTWWWTPA